MPSSSSFRTNASNVAFIRSESGPGAYRSVARCNIPSGSPMAISPNRLLAATSCHTFQLVEGCGATHDLPSDPSPYSHISHPVPSPSTPALSVTATKRFGRERNTTSRWRRGRVPAPVLRWPFSRIGHSLAWSESGMGIPYESVWRWRFLNSWFGGGGKE